MPSPERLNPLCRSTATRCTCAPSQPRRDAETANLPGQSNTGRSTATSRTGTPNHRARTKQPAAPDKAPAAPVHRNQPHRSTATRCTCAPSQPRRDTETANLPGQSNTASEQSNTGRSTATSRTGTPNHRARTKHPPHRYTTPPQRPKTTTAPHHRNGREQHSKKHKHLIV